MISSGVTVGDRVAAVMSNSVDAIVLCLATLSIGAIWSSASCDLGEVGIAQRYKQTKPKIVFADDSYVYAGKLHRMEARIAKWSQALNDVDENLEDVVVLSVTADQPADISAISKGVSFADFCRRGTGRPLEFKQLPFSHPAFILYSSGTTGEPKCIVHSAGGSLLKVRVDSVLQHDIRKSDIVFQYTTTAWVMWVLNFVNLGNCKSMLLYDGSPFHPSSDVLLRLADEIGVNVFGTSPRYLTELRSRNISPRNVFQLKALRIVTSTGAVLSPDVYNWFYDQGFPSSVQLVSMSGGTDIAGCFVGGTPLLPVYAGEIQAKCLGMAIEIFDTAQSSPVPVENKGEAGELVCTQPFPSQPLAFYGSGGMEKYRSSYFERYGPMVWCQGDFIQELVPSDGLIMLGRSDGVLNPSGVRFGSAEIYAVTETFPQIEDAICVGQRREGIDVDEQVLLFVKMRPGQRLDMQLTKDISEAIKNRYSPRHVPRYIFAVADIPYTVNGKKCEINVKQIVNGKVGSISGTITNPESLQLYRKYLHLGQKTTANTDGVVGKVLNSVRARL